MASPQRSSKPASRWGFLSQAVNSIESRLDVILADDEDVKEPAPSQDTESREAPSTTSRDSTETTRSAPTQHNDRLQQRLAAAMARKKAGKLDATPPISEPVSRAATPGIEPSSQVPTQPAEETAEASVTEEQSVSQAEDQNKFQGTDPGRSTMLNEVDPIGNRSSLDARIQRSSRDDTHPSLDKSARISNEEADAVLLQAHLEHEDEKSRMQEEIQGYIERIDALSSKLQYLAKEAVQSAKDAIQSADSDGLEKKLLEKDEQIALLMEEGQKLSVNEMKNLTIIKRLRSQMATHNNDQDAIRRRAEKAEKQLTVLDDKAKRAEQFVAKAEGKIKVLTRTSQDVEALTRERNALNNTLAEMKSQVARANARAETALSKASTEKLEAERKKFTELQDDLTSLKVEHELAEGKLKREIKDLQAALEREKEQSRSMETDMLAEQANLESKLESFRVRAEDASANDQGDSQAKLLRQIETLQSQYAAASQNWQGIQGTLLARITALEKDRDEVTIREADVRKRLRDTSLKSKSHEREVEEMQLKLGALQESQTDEKAELQRLSRRNQQVEEEVLQAQKELEDQRLRLERDFTRKLDEEKAKWAASIRHVRNESPGTSVRKGGDYALERLMSPTMDRPQSRKASALAGVTSPVDSSGSFPRQFSTVSFRGPQNGTIAESPSLTNDADEYFANVPATPGSGENHQSRRGFNDLVSASTVGAGPSVQLVERMSANVRRLESEKAASKDEIARLSTQRDESRSEVVRLMREVEQKKLMHERLTQLEAEHKSLSQRHQTTLELLGEKSEKVEELKHDIADVKQMYRDLADHMK